MDFNYYYYHLLYHAAASIQLLGKALWLKATFCFPSSTFDEQCGIYRLSKVGGVFVVVVVVHATHYRKLYNRLKFNTQVYTNSLVN